MNAALITANLLCLIALVVHAWQGDREIRMIRPHSGNENFRIVLEKWTMARCGWHWISFDLLFATLLLTWINFSKADPEVTWILRILGTCFLGYGLSWLGTIALSKPFPGNYLRLGQWILLWLIGSLILIGSIVS